MGEVAIRSTLTPATATTKERGSKAQGWRGCKAQGISPPAQASEDKGDNLSLESLFSWDADQ